MSHRWVSAVRVCVCCVNDVSVSAYLAVKDAMADYRRQMGLSGYVKIDSPAVPHRVRMACPDKIVEMVSKLTDEKAKKADAEFEVIV